MTLPATGQSLLLALAVVVFLAMALKVLGILSRLGQRLLLVVIVGMVVRVLIEFL